MWPAEGLPASGALPPRPRDAGADPLDDRASLELRKHPEHREQRLAGWRAGIDTLAIEVQIAAGTVKLAKEGDEIL